MTFLGIAVRVSNEIPYLRGVLLDENAPGDAAHFHFTPPASGTNADHLANICNGLSGRLQVLNSPLIRVVFRLGDERQGHAANSIVFRTRAEGAAMAVARALCTEVRALHGKEIGAACGTDKAGADVLGKALVTTEGWTPVANWVPAASAAIAARSL